MEKRLVLLWLRRGSQLRDWLSSLLSGPEVETAADQALAITRRSVRKLNW
jgi:hypothetical protein